MRANLNRFIILALAAVLVAVVAIRFARRSPQPGVRPAVAETTPADAVSTTSDSALPHKAIVSPPPNTSNSTPASLSTTTMPISQRQAKPPASVGPPDETAMLQIDEVNLMIRDYRTLAGENPVGTNAEIMAAVMGDNPKQAKLGPPEGAKLNEKGELIDRWGTPYFFHQLSRDHMEIRSAGPDKVMWNADDPVIR